MISELAPMVNRLKRSRAQLFSSIAGLSEEQLDRTIPGGEWSVKDRLAHLAANERLMTTLAECIATGDQTSLGPDFDNERYNRESVAKSRGKTVDEILDDLTASRARLDEFLLRVKPQQLERRGVHPLHGDMNLRELLLVVHAHETSHAREIAEFARELQRTGELKRGRPNTGEAGPEAAG